MKKIYNILALLGIAFAFTACHPLNKTYKALDGLGKPVQTLNYTIQPADYAILPATVPANKALGFSSATDANANIPTILNYKFFDYADGSNANITYTSKAPTITLPDSVFKDQSYTLTSADYLLLPGNKYADFSIAQVLTWLPYKYTAPVANQQVVLTFTYYNPPAANTAATFAFLYLNGAWQQIYLLTPAQYTAIGHGSYNQFTSADDASLTAYINTLLKADLSVAAVAKVGDVKYVSFNYYNAAKVTDQRVIPFTYNGTNWVTTSLTINTLTFVKSGGSWIQDPTVYYTLVAKDFTLIGNSTVGGTAEASNRTNLLKYGDWETTWTTADLQAAIILALTADFPTPKVNINYKVTYLLYTGGKDVPTVATFQYNGSAWVAK
ncbi:hypothetical protein [Mucilaginibacter sp.]|uniref:hypothetical protein n=1 Tax=Mucilaginibacter sp. TaxID=1882438 RepID=UPI003D14A53F